jgi:hypothetical protein
MTFQFSKLITYKLKNDSEVTKVATFPNIGKSRENFTTLIQQKTRQQTCIIIKLNFEPIFNVWKFQISTDS